MYIVAVFLFSHLCLIHGFGMSYSHVDANGVAFDEKLMQFLNVENGVFVEVGANDGIAQSNTKLLEECYGWTGVLIEPSAVLFDRLVKNRPYSHCFQCALGSFAENNTYVWGDFNGDLMASIDGNRLGQSAQQRVLMRSLQSILDEVGLFDIHFFSLDVEGYELKVLQGIDFNKTRIDYVLVEIYSCHFGEITQFLSDHGYEMVESFSNYNFRSNPGWDGTHNDYLFKRVY